MLIYMQHKQDGFGRQRNHIGPSSATWKLRKQSREDASGCCSGLWGAAFDRGHTVTEWISSDWICCPYSPSDWVLRGRRAWCTFQSRTNRNQSSESQGSVALRSEAGARLGGGGWGGVMWNSLRASFWFIFISMLDRFQTCLLRGI